MNKVDISELNELEIEKTNNDEQVKQINASINQIKQEQQQIETEGKGLANEIIKKITYVQQIADLYKCKFFML